MLYSTMFFLLAFGAALLGCGAMALYGLFSKQQNETVWKLTLALIIIPFVMISLTLIICFGRVEKVTFYSDEYDIIAMADDLGITKYKSTYEGSREHLVSEEWDGKKRYQVWLHEDTIKALENRNEHVGYEEYLKGEK